MSLANQNHWSIICLIYQCTPDGAENKNTLALAVGGLIGKLAEKTRHQYLNVAQMCINVCCRIEQLSLNDVRQGNPNAGPANGNELCGSRAGKTRLATSTRIHS